MHLSMQFPPLPGQGGDRIWGTKDAPPGPKLLLNSSTCQLVVKQSHTMAHLELAWMGCVGASPAVVLRDTSLKAPLTIGLGHLLPCRE